MKTLMAFVLLTLSSLASADVLFEVVSLDCGFCAQFEAEDGVADVEAFARRSGFDYRVGALGPFKETGERPYARPEVYLFFAAAKFAPDRSPEIAETMFRYYGEISETGVRPEKEQLIDQVAIAAGVSPQDLSRNLGAGLKSHFWAWRKTASILQAGMKLNGVRETKTPAFILMKDGEVTGYQHWAGDTQKTASAVKQMIRRARNED